MDTANVHAWLPTVIAGGALALIWADVRASKRQLGKRLEEFALDFRHALYRDDGTTHFMPRNGCEREQSRCQQITCGKIEAISVKMDLMDAKREHAKEQAQIQMADVGKALAVLTERVEELSKDMAKLPQT